VAASGIDRDSTTPPEAAGSRPAASRAALQGLVDHPSPRVLRRAPTAGVRPWALRTGIALDQHPLRPAEGGRSPPRLPAAVDVGAGLGWPADAVPGPTGTLPCGGCAGRGRAGADRGGEPLAAPPPKFCTRRGHRRSSPWRCGAAAVASLKALLVANVAMYAMAPFSAARSGSAFP
jgi:hypothetical protein